MNGARTTRWLGAATIVAAIAIVGTIELRPSSSGATADAALETRVVSSTIEHLEARVADQFNPVVAPKLVAQHQVAFLLDGETRHLRRAAAVASALTRNTLDPGPAYASLSSVRLALHDFSGAHRAAERAFEYAPTNPAVLAARFDAAVATGSYRVAAEALASLRDVDRSSFPFATRKAQWLEAHDQAGPAIETLRPWCERLRSSAALRAHVAWCETRLGDLERGRAEPGAARWWYDRALTTVPGYPAALEGLAELAYSDGDWDRARALYRRIPGDAHADIELRLAEIADAAGDEEAARDHAHRFVALAERPDGIAHPLELALLYASDRSTRDRALELLEREVTHRAAVDVYAALAWTRLQRGELVAALTASGAARRWGSPDATSDYTRARILEGLGENEAASRLYARVVNPSGLEPHAREDFERREASTR